MTTVSSISVNLNTHTQITYERLDVMYLSECHHYRYSIQTLLLWLCAYKQSTRIRRLDKYISNVIVGFCVFAQLNYVSKEFSSHNFS